MSYVNIRVVIRAIWMTIDVIIAKQNINNIITSIICHEFIWSQILYIRMSSYTNPN